MQLAFERLDALLVGPRRLRTGRGLLGLGQGRCGVGTPLVELGRKDAVLTTPGTLAGLVHRRGGDHRFESGARSPGPPAGGPGLRIISPSFQRLHRNPYLS
jgi:hypothetical protein